MPTSPCGIHMAKGSVHRTCTPICCRRLLPKFSVTKGIISRACPEPVRIYAATDLHVDYPENLAWCKALASSNQHRTDALLVAGDVSDDLVLVEEALSMLTSAFRLVFYVPGNHELWLRQQDVGLQHSLEKFAMLRKICKGLGVHTAPLQIVQRVWVVPMVSWHHRSFDEEPDIPGVPPVSRLTIADYAACKWPHEKLGISSKQGSKELAQWFDDLNDSAVWKNLLRERHSCDVISFSHFLPKQALLPEKRFLYYPNLPKAVGSLPLGNRVQTLRPDIHVFGHTHFAWDATIDGTRYIQAPLCSPIERQRRLITVGFASSMEQAEKDPVSAKWLPLQIYSSTVRKTALSQVSAGYNRGSNKNEGWGSSITGDVVRLVGSTGSVSDAVSSGEDEVPCPEELSNMDKAVHGVSPEFEDAPSELTLDSQEEASMIDADQLNSSAAGSEATNNDHAAPASHGGSGTLVGTNELCDSTGKPSPGRGYRRAAIAAAVATSATAQSSASSVQGASWEADPKSDKGAVRLRHGWMPGPLGAHWSAYYDTHCREPSNLALAPWVAKVYSKSRRWKEQHRANLD